MSGGWPQCIQRLLLQLHCSPRRPLPCAPPLMCLPCRPCCACCGCRHLVAVTWRVRLYLQVYREGKDKERLFDLLTLERTRIDSFESHATWQPAASPQDLQVGG